MPRVEYPFKIVKKHDDGAYKKYSVSLSFNIGDLSSCINDKVEYPFKIVKKRDDGACKYYSVSVALMLVIYLRALMMQ